MDGWTDGRTDRQADSIMCLCACVHVEGGGVTLVFWSHQLAALAQEES